MRTLTYYIGISLDGTIAGPAGEVDHYPVSDDHVRHMIEHYPEVLPTAARQHLGIDDLPNRRFDTGVMGRATYEPALALEITDPYAHLRTHVISTDPTIARGDAAITVSPDPVETVRALKEADSPLGIWLVGGGQLAGAVAAEIDELIVKLYPVLAGSGIRAVDGAFAPRAFTLDERWSFDSGCTVLHYRRS